MSSGSISNPVGSAFDAVGVKRPKLNIGGNNIDLTALSNPLGQLGQGMNIYKEGEKKKKIAEAEADAEAAARSDAAQFEKFKAQEANLLNTAGQPLFTPKYKKASAGLKAQTEAMAQLFNARKQEVTQRKAAPGIGQTRMM